MDDLEHAVATGEIAPVDVKTDTRRIGPPGDVTHVGFLRVEVSAARPWAICSESGVVA
jgi:hypothetical protein